MKSNLRDGRLRLIFVADHIPKELRRIIEFLNTQMDLTEVLGLEVPQLVGEGIRSLVPRVVGRTEMTPTKGRAPRKQWDESSFLAEFGKRGPAEAAVAQRIVAWAKEKGLRPWYGAGSQHGTFVPYLDLPNDPGLTVLGLWTNGGLEVRFGYGHARPPFNQPQKRAEYVDRLNRIPEAQLPESFKTAGVCKGIPAAALVPPGNLDQFLAVMDWALDELTIAASSPPDLIDAQRGATSPV